MERLGGVRLLAYEDYYLTVNEFKSYKKDFENVEWTAASAEMELLRMVKNDAELSMLRKAEQIGVDAFLNTIPAIKAGVSENEIAAELEYQMRKMGAEGTAFETIVVSGYKSGMPHGKPGGKRLESGDFVTMDFGCVYNGYCSDMTRTVVIGKANSEQKKIYETVKKAQQKGLDSIRAGALCCDSDKAARDVIKEAGYGEYFKHSLGHGVGMLIHELPNLSPRCNIELKENMIVTCEPGIYLQSGGVRIEDMVRVTESGCENLTKLSKDLLEIG